MGGKGGGGGMMKVLQAVMGGGGGGNWGKKKGNMQMIGRLAKKEPEKLAWIGGLEGKVEKGNEFNKKLKAHMEKKGCPVKFVNITVKGQGGAIFGSEEEAQAAIAALNGTKFLGKTLELDVWTKKDS